MGQELSNRLGLIDNRKMNQSCEEILRALDVDFNIYTRVFSLSTAQKQMLEIAKAISRNVRILVMDEPTAAVSSKEVDKIFQLVRDLKSKGVTIVYISHRMDEIFEIADRITVLRDGANAGTADAAGISREELVRMLVGYSLDQYYARNKRNIGETILTVRNLTRKDGRVRDADISLRKGEIIGLAGLVGSGRTELIETLFGLAPYTKGQITLYGQEVKFHTPEEAL